MVVDPVRLWQVLDEHFTFDELHNLCFALGIDFENIPGDGKKSKARGIVIYCRNRATMEQLVSMVRQERPNLGWGVPEEAESAAEDAPMQSAEHHLYNLVKEFNRNRHQPKSSKRTRVADDITFQMRELVPALDSQFDVDNWLRSANIGKRVAAVEYLEWKQDTEYFGVLLDRLPIEQPFIQFHILIVLSSMLDQLTYEEMLMLRERLEAHDFGGDSSINLWKQDLLNRIHEWFSLVE